MSQIVGYAVAGVIILATVWLIVPRIGSSSIKAVKPIPFSLQLPEQSLPHWKGKRVEQFSLQLAQDASLIQCYCPATGQYLESIAAHNSAEIDELVLAAKEAQKSSWSKSSLDDRKRVLNTIMKYILDHQEDVARVACRDTGKTMLDASLGEIFITLEKINWIVKHGEAALADSYRPGPSNPLLFYKGAKIEYSPLGVVAALVSWNYPLHNLMGPIVAGLFTGNAVVVKCSEAVVWSSKFFIEIAKTALSLNGFDPNTVQLVCCWPKDAEALTAHPDISHITFIGSKPVAHKVLASAAKSLTPVVVELGGKDPFVILNQTSRKTLEATCSVVLRGSFQSAGQNCIGIERVIVESGTYDAVVEILARRVAELRIGSDIDGQGNVDVGATITDARFSSLKTLIEKAVVDGARLLHGGDKYLHPKYSHGHYFTPTLLVDVDPNSEIAQSECFAPIILVFKAQDEQDAVKLANSTKFGLGASVFGPYRSANRVAGQIRSGNVAINDFATYQVSMLPFGGVDESGYGKFNGVEGLRGLCVEKSVSYDKYPFIHTAIPAPLDYPIPDRKRAWEMVKAINVLGYDWGFWNKLQALIKLAKS